MLEPTLMETHQRSILKAVTYRVMGFIATGCVAWLITKDPKAGLAVGAADSLVKVVGYYMHERIWMKVKFGKLPPPDYQI